MIDLPDAPTTINKIESTSTETSATITWNKVADSTSPAGIITGYWLYMTQLSISNTEILIFDGKGLP